MVFLKGYSGISKEYSGTFKGYSGISKGYTGTFKGIQWYF